MNLDGKEKAITEARFDRKGNFSIAA